MPWQEVMEEIEAAGGGVNRWGWKVSEEAELLIRCRPHSDCVRSRYAAGQSTRFTEDAQST